MMKKYDAIIVGAGFAGATMASLFAKDKKHVLLIDKRDHIAGNAYDCLDSNGILIHAYGPHIFHTSFKDVYDYLISFDTFVPYQHKVVGNIDGKIVPIPFNFTSLDVLYSKEDAKKIKDLLAKYFPDQTRVSIFNLLKCEDKVIKNFGQYVFEKVFAHYTAKQWGTSIDKIDTSVINRVPVVLGYEDTYFGDAYQCMPKDGFTSLVQKMIDSPYIDVTLSTPMNKIIKLDGAKRRVLFNGEQYDGLVIFSGALDNLLKYRFGVLPYRSLKLVFEQHDKTHYQGYSVINYTTSEAFTRITEFKYLTGQELCGKTTILKEFPLAYDVSKPESSEAYYPINNAENQAIYNKYLDEIKKYGNVVLCGRLAEYKYYNMDGVIHRAIELYDALKNR